jgi:hypothetical protein
MPARTPAIAAGAKRIGQYILGIRRQRVLLDEDLAALYGVETRALLQAVKRNPERFPPDFTFELSAAEWAALRSQSVTAKPGRGGRRDARPTTETTRCLQGCRLPDRQGEGDEKRVVEFPQLVERQLADVVSQS